MSSVPGAPFGLNGRRALVLADGEGGAAVSCTLLRQFGADVLFLDTAPLDTDALVARVAAIGRVDIFVNFAACDHARPICETSGADLAEALDLVERSFFASQAVAREMAAAPHDQHHRAIIHVASILARVGAADKSTCAMAMHALRGLVVSSALELGTYGITVNLLETAGNGLHEQALAVPVGASDVAAATVYLASPAAAAMTGSSLVLDGGFTAR